MYSITRISEVWQLKPYMDTSSVISTVIVSLSKYVVFVEMESKIVPRVKDVTLEVIVMTEMVLQAPCVQEIPLCVLLILDQVIIVGLDIPPLVRTPVKYRTVEME